MATEAREWVSSAEASARLRVSKKTIWRRAKAGTLEGRKVPGEKGGFEWEIAFDASGQPTDQADKNERPATGQEPSKEAISSVKSSGQGDRPTDHPATGQADSSGRYVTHLEEENAFLRRMVEQLQRDGAEVRAALREALKGRAKELGAGELEANTTAPGTARIDPEREQNAPPANQTPKPPKPQIARTGEHGSMTLGDIADFLERELTQ